MSDNPLPREIAPGVFWLGECMHTPYADGILHSYQSVYLVTGEECSMLVEAGHPAQLETVEHQLEGLIAAGAKPPRYLFATHSETPHAGGTPRLLDHLPDLTFVGDASDLHLYAPRWVGRVEQSDIGDEIDLGGTSFRIVPAVVRDHIQTLWGFDTSRRVLFCGDGVAYTHYHEADQCGCLAEETPTLDIPQMTAMFAEAALHWTRFVDIEPYIDRFQRLVDDLDVQLIAPTHGLPVGDLDLILPQIRAGLRFGSATDTRVSDLA